MAVRRGPPLAYAHRSILRNAGSLANAAIPIRHTSLGTISISGSSLLNARPHVSIFRPQTGSTMKEAPALGTYSGASLGRLDAQRLRSSLMSSLRWFVAKGG